MRKKQRNVLIVILIIALIVGVLAFGKNLPFVVGIGPSYLSISKIDNVGVGSEFLIYATGGSAEELMIDFDASEINQQIAGKGYMVERGISAIARINKWQHAFPIQLTSNSIKSLGVQDIKPYVGAEATCDLSDCSSSNVPRMGTYILSYAYGMGVLPGSYYCKCIYYNDIAKIGQFLSGLQILDYNIDFTVSGETKSMSNANRLVSLVGGKFRAEYVGNLGTEFQLSPPNYDVLYSGGKYSYLIPSNGYDYGGVYGTINNPSQYIKSCSSSASLSTCIGTQCNNNANLISNCINFYGRDTNVGIQIKDNEYSSSIDAKSISLQGNNLVVSSNIPTFYPTFKIFVNAEWVGLKELRGDPEITSCVPSVQIKGGTSKQVSLTIRNKGTEAGQFDYSVICTSNKVSFNGAGVFLEAGQSQTINLLFSGSNDDPSKDLTGTCTHKITDRKSQKSVTCTSSFTVEYSGEFCTPLTLRCNPSNNKEIQECDELGLSWRAKTTCKESCIYDSLLNTVKCSDEPPSPPPSPLCKSCDDYSLNRLFGIIWESKRCKPDLIAIPPQTTVTCIFSFLKLFAIPLVFIFSLLFGQQLFSSFKGLKKREWLSWIIAVIVALILAYMIFILFWVGIIIFIGYMIARIIIGRIRR